MTNADPKLKQAAAAIASRMRLVQMDFADDEDKVREDFLAQEIQAAVHNLTPAQRDAMLDELLLRFPTWEASGPQATDGAADRQGAGTDGIAESTAGTLDQREQNDWTFLVTRLAELKPTLSDQQKAEVETTLREAGVIPAHVAQQWSPDEEAAVRKRLAIDESQAISPQRAIQLLAMLAEFAFSLDQVVWLAFREVAPQSDIKRTTGLDRQMGRFVTGDGDIGREQVLQEWEKNRQMVAGLIAAIGQLPRQFAKDYASKFSPDQIEEWARMQKKNPLGSLESAAWRHYRTLAGSMDDEAIESEMKKLIAGFTENLIKGLR